MASRALSLISTNVDIDGRLIVCYRGPVSAIGCRQKSVSKVKNLAAQAELFKALGDAHRLQLFASIADADDEICVCDLTATLPLGQPTVSHHLRILRDAGLITSERRGTWVYYSVVDGALARIDRALESVVAHVVS